MIRVVVVVVVVIVVIVVAILREGSGEVFRLPMARDNRAVSALPLGRIEGVGDGGYRLLKRKNGRKWKRESKCN